MAVIHARENEFSAATGGNVGATRATSRFDGPPGNYDGLVITSSPDDPRPFVFEEGDTYTVEYIGPDGPVCLIDATVVRSDLLAGPDAGIVVFEGIDPDEGLVQLVWTPNFDLTHWYQNAARFHQNPSFYSHDTQAATYGHVCFAAGTRVRTPEGPRRIETLRPGDLVVTRDNGARPLRWTGERTVLGVGTAAPVLFAPGALGNAAPLYVSQQHRMLLRGRWPELLFGEPEVLVPAKALINGGPIRIVPRPEVSYLHLLFDGHEVIDAEGAGAESLYLGDAALLALGPEVATLIAGKGVASAPPAAARPLLSMREGTVLAARMFAGETARQPARIPA